MTFRVTPGHVKHGSMQNIRQAYSNSRLL